MSVFLPPPTDKPIDLSRIVTDVTIRRACTIDGFLRRHGADPDRQQLITHLEPIPDATGQPSWRETIVLVPSEIAARPECGPIEDLARRYPTLRLVLSFEPSVEDA